VKPAAAGAETSRSAQEGAKAAAVHKGHAGQINDDVLRSLRDQVNHSLLEKWGGVDVDLTSYI
jgi:hypothetical protein